MHGGTEMLYGWLSESEHARPGKQVISSPHLIGTRSLDIQAEAGEEAFGHYWDVVG